MAKTQRKTATRTKSVATTISAPAAQPKAKRTCTYRRIRCGGHPTQIKIIERPDSGIVIDAANAFAMTAPRTDLIAKRQAKRRQAAIVALPGIVAMDLKLAKDIARARPRVIHPMVQIKAFAAEARPSRARWPSDDDLPPAA